MSLTEACTRTRKRVFEADCIPTKLNTVGARFTSKRFLAQAPAALIPQEPLRGVPFRVSGDILLIAQQAELLQRCFDANG